MPTVGGRARHKQIENVWAKPCPKCKAEVDKPCRDLRLACATKYLYGRRTHRERAKEVRKVAVWKAPSRTIFDSARYTPLATQGLDWQQEYVYPFAATTTGTYLPYTWTNNTTNATAGYHVEVAADWNMTATTTTPITWQEVRREYEVGATWEDVRRAETIDGVEVQRMGAEVEVVRRDPEREQTWVRWVDNYGQVNVQRYDNEALYRQWVQHDDARDARRIVERQTADEMQAMRERQARERLAREQRYAEREAAAVVARERAIDLLDSLLTEEERQTRHRDGRVEVLGSDGALYRIEMHRQSVHGNIVRIDMHGCTLGRACVAPEMYDQRDGVLPTADGWVGQYLGLKFDAEVFLSHANWSEMNWGCRHEAVA